MDTNRDGTDAKGADVGEGRDCDGDARLPHRLPDPLRQGESGLLLVAQVAQALHDHEHVVNSDSWNKMKRRKIMSCTARRRIKQYHYH